MTEKYDALDLVIKVLTEHEKNLDRMVESLEKCVEALRKTYQAPNASALGIPRSEGREKILGTKMEPKVLELKPEEEEFVREELAWLAEWIRGKHPEMNYNDIRRVLSERVPVSV